MKLIPIVEGHGDERAVPVLLRKLLHEWHGQYDLRIDTPVRRHRDELAKPDGIRRWVRNVRFDPECAAVVVLQGRGGLKPDPVLPTNGPESVRDAKAKHWFCWGSRDRSFLSSHSLSC